MFKAYTVDHKPISAYVMKVILTMGFSIIALSFILGMFGLTRSIASPFLLKGIFIIPAVLVIYKIYKSIGSISTNEGKIFYCIYILAFFFIGTIIFMSIIYYVIIALIVLTFIFLLIGRLLGGGSSSDDSKPKYFVRSSNGKREEIRQTGTGPTGEKYYRGRDSGDEYRSH